MSVIEDLLAEGMAERVSAVTVPAAMAPSVWRRFRRRRARRRIAGVLATMLTLVGLGALVPGLRMLVPGLVATHSDRAQTAVDAIGAPAPTALRAQLIAALSSDEANVERETVTGATGASGPVQYWYDPATGQSLSQTLDPTGRQVVTQVAALESKPTGAALTVTEMDFVTRTWATATVTSPVPVPVPLVAPPAPTPTSPVSFDGAGGSAALPGPLPSAGTPRPASSAASTFTPTQIQRTVESGDLLVVGHEVIGGQDAVHLMVAEAKVPVAGSGSLTPVTEPGTFELWVDQATGQPIQQLVILGEGRVQTTYSWLAPGQVNLSSLAGVPVGFTKVASPAAVTASGALLPSPA